MHDYSGHPFQLQLSRELSRRGHRVRHQYCTSYKTGKGAIAAAEGDPEGFSIEPLSMADEFARYSPAKRIVQELRYGGSVGWDLRSSRPDLVVLCNVPLLAHAVIAITLLLVGIPMIFWQQDVYSDAIGSTARHRLGRIPGGTVAWVADRMERFIAHHSAHVIAISQDFRDVLARWGVSAQSITIIPNWAPLDEMPVRPRENDWARSHGLADKKVVLYSGTLGIKHNPQIFVELAQALEQHDPDTRLVVVSEGRGREFLEEERRRLGLGNLVLVDYQPYEDLPDVLAAADVLIAVLEPDAGRYSVPSKVLSYLCSARPIIAVIPADNQAAAALGESGAGISIEPEDHSEAVSHVIDLLSAPDRRAQMGAAGRRYAEATFDISAIGSQFEAVLTSVKLSNAGRQPVGANGSSRN